MTVSIGKFEFLKVDVSMSASVGPKEMISECERLLTDAVDLYLSNEIDNGLKSLNVKGVKSPKLHKITKKEVDNHQPPKRVRR